MKNILIISSTKSNNYLLSKNLCDLIDDGVNKNNISFGDYINQLEDHTIINIIKDQLKAP